MRSISTLLSWGLADSHLVAFGKGVNYDWRTFRADVEQLSLRLRSSGGHRFFLISDDVYAFAVGLLGILHSGADVLLPASSRDACIGEAEREGAGVVAHEMTSGDKPTLRHFPILPPGPRVSDSSWLPIDPNNAKIVLYTSGSTGQRLAVCKPLGCFEAEIAALESIFGRLAPKSVLATVVPFHIYGLLFRVLWPLAAGRPFDVHTINFPSELMATLTTSDAPFLVSSPTFLKRALAVLDLAAVRTHLRGVFSSGGQLEPAVAAAYNRVLAEPVFEVYGSTETGGIGYRTVMDADTVVTWTPMPDVELCVEPRGEVLAVRSPYASSNDWVPTGDRASLMPNGRFLLHGRADRIAKIEGKRVSIAEVERRLEACPEVAAVRVLGLEHAGREMLGAVVVPSPVGWSRLEREGKWALKQDLAATLRCCLDAVVLPRRWRFVRQLPVDTQSKTSVHELSLLFAPTQGRIVLPDVLDQRDVENEARLRLYLQPELFYFQGHFEEAPILPGVVQLDWAIHFARKKFSVAGSCRGLEVLKFVNVLPAGKEVMLSLRYDRPQNKVHFHYQTREREHASGRILFQNCP